MDNKYLLSELLWVIPYSKTLFLKNQNKEIYSFPQKMEKTHLDYFNVLFDHLDLPRPSKETDDAYAFILASYGYATVLNGAAPFDGKYFAPGIILPEQLSSYQIQFFENVKKLFEDHYHLNLMQTTIYTEQKLPYNSLHRKLKIEAIINGEKEKNDFELLYDEIEKQKESIMKKSLE